MHRGVPFKDRLGKVLHEFPHISFTLHKRADIGELVRKASTSKGFKKLEGRGNLGIVRDCDDLPLQASPDFQHARRHGGATTERQLPQARGKSILEEVGNAYGADSSSARKASDFSQEGLQEIRSSNEAGRASAVRTLVLQSAPAHGLPMFIAEVDPKHPSCFFKA